jgi:hypothetical protein
MTMQVGVPEVKPDHAEGRASLSRLFQELRSGHWYHGLIVDYVRSYNAERPSRPCLHTSPVRAARRVADRARLQAAWLGTGAAAITTGASIVTGETHGLAGLVAIPAAGAAMLGDMLARARVMLGMTCELAELFAIRFDPDDPADLARLYAVVHQAVQQPEQGDARGHDLLESLSNMHPEQLASAVGLSTISETLSRNVVPVIGVFTSGWTSYRLTEQLAQATLHYVRTRRALDEAFEPIARAAPELLDLLVEGVWFMFSSDGQLNAHEAAVVAHLVHARPSEVRRALLDRLRDDEPAWLERLASVAPAQRPDFLRALVVAAAVDTEVTTGERELLERAARALQLPTPDRELDQLATRFHESGVAAGPGVMEAE